MSDAATPLPLAIDPRFRNRERQPGLDLLRALAIIVVVVYHAALFGFNCPGEWTASAGSVSIFSLS
jgi:peptidoglycan/LPS O-acetylase OafA/YrhL